MYGLHIRIYWNKADVAWILICSPCNVSSITVYPYMPSMQRQLYYSISLYAVHTTSALFQYILICSPYTASSITVYPYMQSIQRQLYYSISLYAVHATSALLQYILICSPCNASSITVALHGLHIRIYCNRADVAWTAYKDIL
jgi:sorbitol-specific phosphotransferase system component IIC